MEELIESWDRRPMVKALQGCRSFQLVASMVIVSKLGDLSRFKHPRQLMAYPGLVPSESSVQSPRPARPASQQGHRGGGPGITRLHLGIARVVQAESQARKVA